jgi:purine nucleosidase
MLQQKVIIDCDTGQDDAIALLLALASPELEILGITTVAGNVALPMTQRNTRLICEMVGRNDIGVYAGCERPLKRDLVTAEEYHGVNGLNGIDIYEPALPLQCQHAVEFIIQTLEAQPNDSVTIIAIAPLTNVATAIQSAPQILPKIKEIVFMGGSARELGNVTAMAEFNIYVDPDAAQIVLKCGRPITVFGLDATHQARMDATWQQRLNALRVTRASEILQVSVQYFNKVYLEIYGQSSAPIHDVLTVAYLLQHRLFDHQLVNIEVETTSELTMGVTVVDIWGLSGRVKNANWVTGVDTDGLFTLLLERVATL